MIFVLHPPPWKHPVEISPSSWSFRIGCLLDLHLYCHLWNSFPCFLLETWLPGFSVFLFPPCALSKWAVNILLASGERVRVMKILLHTFILPMYNNLEESFSLRVLKAFPCSREYLLASDIAVGHFNANLISNIVHVILFSALGVFRIFILPPLLWNFIVNLFIMLSNKVSPLNLETFNYGKISLTSFWIVLSNFFIFFENFLRLWTFWTNFIRCYLFPTIFHHFVFLFHCLEFFSNIYICSFYQTLYFGAFNFQEKTYLLF